MEKPWVGFLTGLPRQLSTIRRAESPDPPTPWRRIRGIAKILARLD
jgi:hypothetical protein